VRIPVAAAAKPQTITLKVWTGRGFAPDLVNYSIPAQLGFCQSEIAKKKHWR